MQNTADGSQLSFEELQAKQELLLDYENRRQAIFIEGGTPAAIDARLRLLDYWVGQRVLRIEFDCRQPKLHLK